MWATDNFRFIMRRFGVVILQAVMILIYPYNFQVVAVSSIVQTTNTTTNITTNVTVVTNSYVQEAGSWMMIASVILYGTITTLLRTLAVN